MKTKHAYLFLFLLLGTSTQEAIGQQIQKAIATYGIQKGSASDKSVSVDGFSNFVFNNATTVPGFNLLADLTGSDTIYFSKKVRNDLKSQKTSSDKEAYLDTHKNGPLTNWIAILDVRSKLYGLQKASTVNQDSIGLALLVPENSQWGIQLSISTIAAKLRNSKGKVADFAVAVGGKIDYTSKKMKSVDAEGNEIGNYEIGQFLIRPGVEVVYKDLISLYADWNWNAVSTGVNDFRKVFEDIEKLNLTYYDVGLRANYNLTKSERTSVNLDFNFIVMNSDLKLLYNTSDRLIPLIRLGFSQSLYFQK
jgi:hypothetical protein